MPSPVTLMAQMISGSRRGRRVSWILLSVRVTSEDTPLFLSPSLRRHPGRRPRIG